MMLNLSIAVVVFICSFVLTWLLRIYALKNNVIDIPNQRSSHSSPTPRGGGVALVISFLIGLVVLCLMKIIPVEQLLSLFIAGAIIAVVGFLDDHGHIAARWRLLMHFIAAAAGLYFLGKFPVIDLFGFELSSGWIGMVFGLVYLAWMLNLYNFMDGINGLASIEAISFSFSSCLLLLNTTLGVSDSGLFSVLVMLGSSTLGFMLWNFPKAKIFMGDAGSGFLGMVVGLIVLHLAMINSSMFMAEICLLGVFIVDATITLLRRLIAGKKVYEAHASHTYQIMARKFESHKTVTTVVLVVNLVWLTPVAILIARGSLTGVVGVLIAWIPLCLIAYFGGAGVKDREKIST
ncbi:glycosyltransferase family 4 protein [Rahnella variigena]|uniref:MraY family glycosyltransferase n=1 Tax=Rahnella variigena TaxID=574964 RepID=UPI0031332296